MDIESMLANIEDLGLESIETKADIYAILKPNMRIEKTRKETKREIIQSAEAMGIDCSILKTKLNRKAENAYLELLSYGINIGLFAVEGLTAPQIKRLATALFADGLFKEEEFKYSTPFGTMLMACYAIGHPEKMSAFPKQYVMDLEFACTLDLIMDNTEVLAEYMEVFNESSYKDGLYFALLDVLETLKGKELKDFKSKILGTELSLKEKEDLLYSKLKATNDGLKHLLDFIRYVTNTEEGNKLDDTDKFNSCIREGVLAEELTETMLDYTVWCDDEGITTLPTEEEMGEIMNSIRNALDNLK